MRVSVYHDNGTIAHAKIFKNVEEWDLPVKMKFWFEYPDSTKFARYPYDILYTPIFFANEGISGDLCLEAQAEVARDILHLSAEITLKGEASLGVMNIGGVPTNLYDSRYALSNIGFRPLVRIPILDVYDTVALTSGPYERNGVVGRRIPFSFPLQANNLNELLELTPSLKLISSDTETTLSQLKDHCPTMIVNVKYELTAVLLAGNQTRQRVEQEIRVFTSLDELQVPSPLPDISPNIYDHRRSSMVSLKAKARPSLLGSRRKSVYEGGNHVIIEADHVDSFCFQTHSDAAATRVRLHLTWSGPDVGEQDPGEVQANVEWYLRSVATISVQASNRPAEAEDAFHLRTKHLPVRKLKMNWTNWERAPEDETPSGDARPWRSVQDLWLTQPIASGLSPTFRTSFISHSYSIGLNFSLGGKALKGKGYKVELNVPVKVRYDIGLAPSYAIDRSLPGYSVDEGEYTQQPGPGMDHPQPDNYADIPPPDVAVERHGPVRFTPEELADLVRTTQIEADAVAARDIRDARPGTRAAG